MSEHSDNKKIVWLDNLRGTACLMVILIHTTSWYVTHGLGIGSVNWAFANVLNSASRVAVPLFFMISGYLFFGPRSASGKHFRRIALCLLFYSLIGLLYMATFTPINAERALLGALNKPVFYHLWFFYAVVIVYLCSPLIEVKPTHARYLLVVGLIVAVVANPNTVAWRPDGVPLLPVNLYINGDTLYYLLYAVMGRAIGMLDLSGKRGSYWAAAGFIVAVALIAIGTKRQMIINGDFADTYYVYCGPLVFIAAISLFLLFKLCLWRRPLPLLTLVSRHSLAIYGFHAFIIHYLRTHALDVRQWALLDIPYVFALTLAISLALAVGLSRIDRRRWVS